MDIFIIIEIILISVFFIVNITIAFYPFKYNLENSEIISMIILNLKGELIYFLKTDNSNCYNSEQLEIDYFGNTPEFCNCKGVNIGNSKCPSSSKDCKTINSIPRKSFTTINSQYFCVKKLKGSYINYLISENVIPKDKECQNNYTSCGIIDTLGRKLCMENAKECPIKKRDIEKNNDTSEQILSVFKLRPNYPCANPTEKNWIYYGDLSPLSKYCTKSDYRYEKIEGFNTTQYDLFKDNNILNILPNYDVDILKNDNIYLYGRNFFGMDKEKAQQFSKSKLLSFEDTINTSNTLNKVISIILLAPVFCLPLMSSNSSSSSSKETISCLLSMTAIYAIPIALIYFITSIIIFNNHNKITSMLDIGSDEYITSLINEFLSGSGINYVCPLISFISFPIIIIVGVIILCRLE